MSTENENDLVTQRRQDLKELRKIGNAYTNKFKRDSLASDLFSQFQDKTKEELENFLIKFLKEKNIKYPIFGKPLRFILTKSYDGPSLSDIFFILGKKSSLERLNQYITKLNYG